MFTHSLRFFDNNKVNEVLPQISNEVEDPTGADFREEGKAPTFYQAINSTKIPNWALEYSVTVNKNGPCTVRQLLENCEEKHPDILYDFRGEISVLLGEPGREELHRIAPENCTRNFPLYKCATSGEELKFHTYGEVSFKIAVLNSELRLKIKRTPMQIPFNDQFMIRYVDGSFCKISYRGNSSLPAYKRDTDLLLSCA